MIVAANEIRGGAFRVMPAGAGCPRPPLVEVTQIDWTRRSRKDERAGNEVLRRGPRKVGRVERPFGYGAIASLLDEPVELPVGDLERVDPEPGNRDPVGGCLLGVVLVRAHLERAAADPRDPLGRRRFRHPALAGVSLITEPGREDGRPVVLDADHRPVLCLGLLESAFGAGDVVEFALGIVMKD